MLSTFRIQTSLHSQSIYLSVCLSVCLSIIYLYFAFGSNAFLHVGALRGHSTVVRFYHAFKKVEFQVKLNSLSIFTNAFANRSLSSQHA